MADKGRDGRFHGKPTGSRKALPSTSGGQTPVGFSHQSPPPKTGNAGRQPKIRDPFGRRK
ncbi:MAG TPA: hypothetical protein VFG56_02950 [Candidatus Saccharimonadales bacterium]|nr:hypothetical protein [Candidatus Saccharimonadales bacterium]